MIIRKAMMLAGLFASTALQVPAALAEEPAPAPPTLEAQFDNPPNGARPRVWWHWMNGNVTKDGIVKDLDWMVRVGIGGLQNFDVDLSTPIMVKNRLVYMTPEWKDAFRFAAVEADKRGLELAIAASPGWSETGGPWVKPEDGLKKVVWSETPVSGGKRFKGKLNPLPGVTGPFQDMPFFDPLAGLSGAKPAEKPQYGGEIAVYAVPARHAPLAQPVAADGGGKPLDAAALVDASLSSLIELPRGTAEAPATVVYDYGKPVSVSSASVFLPGAKWMFGTANVAPRIEASDDGKTWRKVADVGVTAVPTTTGFNTATARWFRLVLAPAAFAGSNLGNPAPGIEPPLFIQMLTGASSAPHKLAQFSLSGEERVDRFEAKAGFALELDYYKLHFQGLSVTPAPLQPAINLTGLMQPDGTLNWKAPKGNWKVIRIGHSLLGTTNHPAPKEATGLEVDKFDGAAVEGYLNHYIGMYRDAAGADMLGQRGVRAILTDSIEVGAANWTPRMVEQFKRLRGYDPVPYLPALTGTVIHSREASDRFLYDYRRTLADLMVSEHYATVARVAHANGLKVYGEALEDHRPSLGDDMAMRAHADVPMAALWTHSRAGGPNPSYIADMKGAASVAHLYGQNLAAAESMTSAVSYWADSPRTLKRIIDLEFVTGINRPVIHTSVHSPDEAGEPGLSLMIFGQYFNRHEGWAEVAKPWVDYIARNSYMLQQGRYFADVAYFHGEEAPLTALYGDKPVADAPTRYAYDFVNPGAVMDILRNDGADLVAPSGARYRVLYLGGSSHMMTLPMLKRLAALVEGGATVVGKAPAGSPSLGDNSEEYNALISKLWPDSGPAQHGKGWVIASNDVEEALATLGVTPDFRFTGAADADLPFLHRRLADGDSYFIVNRKDRAETVEARFRVTGKVPELWDAETGKSRAVSYRIDGNETIVPLSLKAEGSIHVVFRIPASAGSQIVTAPILKPLATLSAPWNVAFQPGRGAPASITLPALKPLDQHADTGVKHFAGLATYSQSFNLPKGVRPGQPLWLDLGEVREVAEVWVNGKLVGHAWHAPYRIDISSAVRKGQNSLEIRVGTLWVNRLIGDAQPGAVKLTNTALPTYKADAPLQPAGLIGPVTLLGAGK
jgi:alpha-L-rhamnosidase